MHILWTGSEAMKVVYGHTDSIYVQMPIDKAPETLDLLNNHVRGIFPNLLGLEQHPVTLEFEKYFDSLGVGKTKNRNAGLISWKDGKVLDEKEFTMKHYGGEPFSPERLLEDISKVNYSGINWKKLKI